MQSIEDVVTGASALGRLAERLRGALWPVGDALRHELTQFGSNEWIRSQINLGREIGWQGKPMATAGMFGMVLGGLAGFVVVHRAIGVMMMLNALDMLQFMCKIKCMSR